MPRGGGDFSSRGGRGRGRGGGGNKGQWRGQRGNWRGKWRGGRGSGNRGRGGQNPNLMPPPSQPLPSTPSATTVVSSQPVSIHVMSDSGQQCPYKAWKLYLPSEEYDQKGEMVKRVRAARKFLLKQDKVDNDELYEKRCFTVDIPAVLEDAELNESWKDLRSQMTESPELVWGVFGLAKHQSVLDEMSAKLNRESQEAGFQPDFEVKFPIVRARLLNHEPLSPIQDLKTRDYGRLVSVKGTVVRVSNVKPVCTWLAFECVLCHAAQSVHQPYGKFLEPLKCVGPGCRGKRFGPLRSHKYTLTQDWQTVRLQEIVQHESGRVPRTIESEMTEDLCDSAMPGDVVTLTGVVRNINLAEKGRDRYIFQLYVHGLSVKNEKTRSRANKSGAESAKSGIEFTYEDYSAIQEIEAFESQLFKLLVHSLCPSIYGHDLVKAGLLLGMFGGTSKYQSDRTHIPVRGDPHILVVGDPGLGKSQMLNSCASIAPRGVFVTGNTTTTSGLTVTLSKESGNDFSLEAGALVLADQGVCCIDEFDKMSNQHQALLEAMEQQSISIAKSSVVCTLPARTAILAAANPVGGHYNKAKTVSENLKMNPALLSRFDLVFILIDKPNAELDGLLSTHIMNLHSKKGRRTNADASLDTSVGSRITEQHADDTLYNRLRKRQGEVIEPIPHDLVRKYVAYARQWVFPKLTAGACETLQDFYLELRRRHQTEDFTPITMRQLESLIRLTEARARLELREEATERDACDVIEIMRSSMVDTFGDGDGALDFSRSLNGSGMSSRGAAKKFVLAMQRHAENLRRSTFSVEEMKMVLQSCGAKVANFFDFLQSLNTQGYLIKKTSKVYQLLTVDY